MPARKSSHRNGKEPLRIVQEEILEAARGFGLDPIRTVFELVAHDELNEMANHGTRIRRYLERHGEKTVEEFLDAALSLEWLIDYHSVYSPTRKRTRYDFSEPEDPAAVRRLRTDHDYMDRYINPPDYLEA